VYTSTHDKQTTHKRKPTPAPRTRSRNGKETAAHCDTNGGSPAHEFFIVKREIKEKYDEQRVGIMPVPVGGAVYRTGILGGRGTKRGTAVKKECRGIQ
jgi:hypothetical protein